MLDFFIHFPVAAGVHIVGIELESDLMLFWLAFTAGELKVFDPLAARAFVNYLGAIVARKSCFALAEFEIFSSLLVFLEA
ncbi:hypothetical protein N9L76_01550 [bacterium]|nr:hypothetical protein [bacterium]